MRQASLVLTIILLLAVPLSGCLQEAPPSEDRNASAHTPAFRLPAGTPLQQAAAALRQADADLFGALPSTAGPEAGLPLSAGIADLAAGHGHALTAAERARVATLDLLPAETADALAAVLDAFGHLQATTRLAYADPVRPDHAAIAAAQHRVVDAAVALDDALARHGTGTLANRQAPITVGAILAIDIAGFDDVYATPFMFIIETGGSDTYRNNAGGNALTVQHCSSDEELAPRVPTVGALIDLSGDDLYEPGRNCGTNGGGAYGVGMLVDADGSDTYTARGMGANGGGYAYGQGLLLDAAGADVYGGTGAGLNGGGYAGGVGRLVDVRGSDSYTASDYGSNGGAQGAWHCVNMCQEAKVSLGMLLDLGGVDSYWDLVVRGTDRTVFPKETSGIQIDLVVTS